MAPCLSPGSAFLGGGIARTSLRPRGAARRAVSETSKPKPCHTHFRTLCRAIQHVSMNERAAATVIPNNPREALAK